MTEPRPFTDAPAAMPGMRFRAYARGLAELIRNAPHDPLTIGVLGGYGAGKTTLMRAVAQALWRRDEPSEDAKAHEPREESGLFLIEELVGGQADADEEPKDHADPVLVWFDAWRHDHEKHLFLPFLANLASHEAFARREPLAKSIRRAAASFLAGLSLRIPLAGIGLSVDGILKARDGRRVDEQDNLGKLTSGYVNIPACLRKLTTPADGGFRKLVIFVDDLDRCLPDKAFALLESLKAFTDIPGIIYVLGLDPRAIRTYVKRKYDEGFVDSEEYLEKMIQVPFHLPRPRASDIELQVAELLNARKSDERWRAVLEALKDRWDMLPSTIRKVKRLLNLHELVSNTQEVDGDVPRPVLLFGLLLLYVRWPAAYRRMQDDREGYPSAMTDRRQLDQFANTVGEHGSKLLGAAYRDLIIERAPDIATVNAHLDVLGPVLLPAAHRRKAT